MRQQEYLLKIFLDLNTIFIFNLIKNKIDNRNI